MTWLRLLNGLMHDARDLDWPVAAIAKKAQGGHADEWADFVEHGRLTLFKEAFDGVECGGVQFFEESEAEGLGDGRVDAVEDRECASATDPFGAAIGEDPAAGDGELRAGMGFGALEALGEGVV
jgi:hypothetical protein